MLFTSARMKLTSKYSCCLICCNNSTSASDDTETTLYNESNSNSSSTSANLSGYDDYAVTEATNKIFQYLLLPEEKVLELKKNKSILSFCPRCQTFVDEIIHLQRKIKMLEMQIQQKVETIGRIAIDIRKTPTLKKNQQKEAAEIWKLFRAPVTRNFLQGLLPNPCVKLAKTVDLDTKTVVQLGEVQDSPTGILRKSKESLTQKSNCLITLDESGDSEPLTNIDKESSSYYYIKEAGVKSESDDVEGHEQEVINVGIKVDLDEISLEDSEDDLFEVVPQSVLAEMRQTATEQEKTNGIRDNVENVDTSCSQDKNVDVELNQPTPVLLSLRTVLSTIDDVKDEILEGNEGFDSVESSNLIQNSHVNHNNETEIQSEKFRTESLSSLPSSTNIAVDCTNDALSKIVDEGIEIISHTTNAHNISSGFVNEDFEIISLTATVDYDQCNENIITTEKKGTEISEIHQSAEYLQEIRRSSIDEPVDDNDKGLRSRPVRSSAPKSFKSFSRDQDELSEQGSHNNMDLADSDSDSDFEISEVDSESDSQSTYGFKTKPKTKYLTTPKDLHGSEKVNTKAKSNTGGLHKGNVIFDSKQVKKRSKKREEVIKQKTNFLTLSKDLQNSEKNTAGLHRGNVILSSEQAKKSSRPITLKSSFDCTKCDYYRRDNLRLQLSGHYSIHHNPVQTTQVSQTTLGKLCYKCTKCSFFIVLSSNSHDDRITGHQKLSLHYMDLHDKLETIWGMTTTDDNSPKSLVEGIHYYLCPCVTCNFHTFIVSALNEKKLCENAAIARIKIIEHFRVSTFHSRERKEVLPDFSSILKDNRSCYKCPNCEYTISVSFSKCNAEKALNMHFIGEHIFSWKCFPGYKYLYYEEKCGCDDILKCAYSGCNFHLIINYNLEGKTREECKFEANQFFISEHASIHNKNSIGSTRIQLRSAEKVVSIPDNIESQQFRPILSISQSSELKSSAENQVSCSNKNNNGTQFLIKNTLDGPVYYVIKKLGDNDLRCTANKDVLLSNSSEEGQVQNVTQNAGDCEERSTANKDAVSCNNSLEGPVHNVTPNAGENNLESSSNLKVALYNNISEGQVDEVIQNAGENEDASCNKTLEGQKQQVIQNACDSESRSTEIIANVNSAVTSNKPFEGQVLYLIQIQNASNSESKPVENVDKNVEKEICVLELSDDENDRSIQAVEKEGIDTTRKRKRQMRSCVSKKLKENPNPDDDSHPNEGSEMDFETSSDSDSDIESDLHPQKGIFESTERLKINEAGDKYLREFTKLPEQVQKMLDTLTEGKDYWKCSKCQFFSLLSESRSRSQKPESKAEATRERVNAHYSDYHNPVKSTDRFISKNGEHFHKCTKCSFIQVIGTGQPKRWLNRLSAHYMKVHDANDIEKNSALSSPMEMDKLKNLIETVDYFRCPDAICKYYTLFNRTNRISHNEQVINERNRVIAHFNTHHNPELKLAISKAFLDEADGTVSYKCPECDFKSFVQKDKDGKNIHMGQTKAKDCLRNHFTKLHLKPWERFPGLYQEKCIEEKCGDDDILKCSFSDCQYFVVITYLEGRTREKCRCIAYNTIRRHVLSNHLKKKKATKTKGYSNVGIPLTIGNQKISNSLKATDSVGGNKKDAHVAETPVIETENAMPSNSSALISSPEIVPNSDTTVAEDSSSQPPRQWLVLCSDSNKDDVSTTANESLRRSKRTTAIKRKSYNVNDIGQEKDEDFVPSSSSEDERSSEDESDCPQDLNDNVSSKNCSSQVAACSGASHPCASSSEVNIQNDHYYDCWNCDFRIKVDYAKYSHGPGYNRYKARHVLSIHFNASHNFEELSFHDPDKLLEVIDGKNCFRCPRCDYFEEIRFNPKKHVDIIQGRKNARVNLGRHFFFIHSVPEKFGSSIEEVDNSNMDLNKESEVLISDSSKIVEEGGVVEGQEKTSDPNLDNAETAEVSPKEQLSLTDSNMCISESIEIPSSTHQLPLADDNNEDDSEKSEIPISE